MSDPKDLNPILETDSHAPKDLPPLTVMSLSVRSIVNHQQNNREVVCTTARIWSNSKCLGCRLDSDVHIVSYVVQLEDPTPPETLPCSVHTFVRPLDRFPPQFEARAKANVKGVIMPMHNERVLLNNLLRE